MRKTTDIYHTTIFCLKKLHECRTLIRSGGEHTVCRLAFSSLLFTDSSSFATVGSFATSKADRPGFADSTASSSSSDESSSSVENPYKCTSSSSSPSLASGAFSESEDGGEGNLAFCLIFVDLVTVCLDDLALALTDKSMGDCLDDGVLDEDFVLGLLGRSSSPSLSDSGDGARTLDFLGFSLACSALSALTFVFFSSFGGSVNLAFRDTASASLFGVGVFLSLTGFTGLVVVADSAGALAFGFDFTLVVAILKRK